MIPAALAFLILAPAAWIVGSSALLCLITNRWPLFVFPYDQWLQAVVWFRAVSMVMRLAIIGSGIIPTAIVVLLVLSVFNRLRRRRIRPALYGRYWLGWPRKCVAAGSAGAERSNVFQPRRSGLRPNSDDLPNGDGLVAADGSPKPPKHILA